MGFGQYDYFSMFINKIWSFHLKKVVGGKTLLKLTMQVSQWRIVTGKANKYSVLITWLKKFPFQSITFMILQELIQKYPVILE